MTMLLVLVVLGCLMEVHGVSETPCVSADPINSFSWVDYTVLALMLIISCGIGVFYGFFGEKQTTSDDFLLGGSSMGTFPMALSLAASFITAIELLGNPGEMYLHGSQFWLICIAFILVVPITSNLYLPVYMKLRLTSSFEYLQLRFCGSVRSLASFLYIVQMVLYTSVAVYAPALALSNVTGLNTYIAVTLVYIVCIFYASQGGMKAVIMTDTFQAAVLVGSVLVVLFLGQEILGGPHVLFTDSIKTHRFELFNMNPDPTIRHSFWSVVVGGTFYWTAMFCSNQASIQKYLSVEKISQVRCALWVSCVGLCLIYSINFYTGMILVSNYKNCDPLTSGSITASDQLLPLYVMQSQGHYQGVAGFFVAGIFAASLGTVASALTSMAAVACQDFISGAFNYTLPEGTGATVAKWISLGLGVLSFILVLVVEHLGSVMQLALSFNGMVGGVTLGLFSLGMLFPWTNSKGALSGATVALILVSWIGIGAQITTAGQSSINTKPLFTDGCACSVNETIAESDTDDDECWYIYRISYLWYSGIGCVVTVVTGLLVTYFTGPQDISTIPVDLISPAVINLIHKLPQGLKKFMNVEMKRKIKPEERKNSIIKVIAHSEKKDIDRRRRLSQQNGGVFYNVWVANGTYTLTPVQQQQLQLDSGNNGCFHISDVERPH